MTENKSAVVQSRVDAQVVKHTDVIFKQLGLTRSRAIEIFLLKVVENDGLPFDLKVPNSVSREIERRAQEVRGDE